MVIGKSVLTALHVVEGDESVEVHVGDGSRVDARVVYENPKLDIARLELACAAEAASRAPLAIYKPGVPLENKPVRTHRMCLSLNPESFVMRFCEVLGHDFADAKTHILRLAQNEADRRMEGYRAGYKKLFNETELEAMRQDHVERETERLEETSKRAAFAFRSYTVGHGSSGAPVLVVQEGQTRVAGIERSTAVVTHEVNEGWPTGTHFVVSMEKILAENDIDLSKMEEMA